MEKAPRDAQENIVEISEDELMAAAKTVMERFLPAFEELAK